MSCLHQPPHILSTGPSSYLAISILSTSPYPYYPYYQHVHIQWILSISSHIVSRSTAFLDPEYFPKLITVINVAITINPATNIQRCHIVNGNTYSLFTAQITFCHNWRKRAKTRSNEMFEDIFQHLLAILLPRDTWPIIIFGPDGNLQLLSSVLSHEWPLKANPYCGYCHHHHHRHHHHRQQHLNLFL